MEFSILIVDDLEENLYALEILLDSIKKTDSVEKIHIYKALSGEECLELAISKELNLIITDIQMPNMNGFEVAKFLNSNSKTKDIPIIFLTAVFKSEEFVKNGFQVGAIDYFTKPIEKNQFLSKVKIYIELYAKNRELEEKILEIQRTQSKMIHQEKMASIGRLAAGVAHELNNPLFFIMVNFSTLKDYFKSITEYLEKSEELLTITKVVKEDPSARSKLEEISNEMISFKSNNDFDFLLKDIEDLFTESTEGLDRVSKIIQNLKTFSSIDLIDKKGEYNINKGIEDTLLVASNEYKNNSRISLDLSDTIVPFETNGAEINQVLINLIINAAHSFETNSNKDKNIISIKTYLEDKYVVCEVADTGSGINKEDINNIFDPFFTTKDPGEGTGLGLNISYDIIVNKNNGILNVESTIGEGSKFVVKLPFK